MKKMTRHKNLSGEKYPWPVWLKQTEEDLKKIIADLSEKYPAAQIGLILRDQYGIPTTKIYGKKMSAYLKEIKKDSSSELKNIEKRLEKIKEHIKSNITDKKAKHKLQKLQSKYNSTKRYVEKKQSKK